MGFVRGRNWVAAGLLVILSGCGESVEHPKVAPVSGVVTLKGVPVEGADVSFLKDKAPRAAIGRTDANGKYQLTMFGNNDGALPGKNVVTITLPTESITMEQMMAVKDKPAASGKLSASGKPVIPAEYSSPTSTPLSYEVKEGPNEGANFEIP